MDISIIGLGYVGAVCSACMAKNGHSVIGVDVNQTKLDLINQGKSPIVEKDLDEFIQEAVKDGRLKATSDIKNAVLESDISIICVGTPSYANGGLDLEYVRKVCEEVGNAMKQKNRRHIVVMRSTVLPGTAYDLAIPTLEKASGLKVNEGFGYVSNPEFLRESTAVYDFFNPPKTVIGASCQQDGDQIASFYTDLPAPIIRVDIPTAEMVKYTDNAWHAVKVTFANEIGNLAKEQGIDGQKVMEIFCMDKKLNLSPYYFRPGFAFGGSCLPKDVRAINYKAMHLDLKTPLLNSLLNSNADQIRRAYQMIKATCKRKVGLLGLSFKAGTDDLRESPLVELAEMLIGKGFALRVYDRNVHLASLTGGNRDYILNHIPHISNLLRENIEDVVEHAEVLVVGHNTDEIKTKVEPLIRQDSHHIIDLVRITDQTSTDKYQGICW